MACQTVLCKPFAKNPLTLPDWAIPRRKTVSRSCFVPKSVPGSCGIYYSFAMYIPSHSLQPTCLLPWRHMWRDMRGHSFLQHNQNQLKTRSQTQMQRRNWGQSELLGTMIEMDFWLSFSWWVFSKAKRVIQGLKSRFSMMLRSNSIFVSMLLQSLKDPNFKHIITWYPFYFTS